MSIEQTVMVGDERHYVSVFEISTGVWIAIGRFQSERIRVQGASEVDAVERWRHAADLRPKK